jgi:hypothetical protein
MTPGTDIIRFLSDQTGRRSNDPVVMVGMKTWYARLTCSGRSLALRNQDTQGTWDVATCSRDITRLLQNHLLNLENRLDRHMMGYGEARGTLSMPPKEGYD